MQHFAGQKVVISDTTRGIIGQANYVISTARQR
jgi:hypothetical protein